MVLRNFFCVAGDTWTVSQRQSAVHTSEITPSETATRGTLTPLARSAINSLSAESRPNTSRIAVKSPHGIVKMSENGKT